MTRRADTTLSVEANILKYVFLFHKVKSVNKNKVWEWMQNSCIHP